MSIDTKKSKKSKRIGYARVSTDGQTLYQYEDLLTTAGCDHIFMDDGVSAVAKNRPALMEARAVLKSGDTFIVPAIDRAFRSTIEGITFLDALHADGITFESIYQQLNTQTPEGRKWFIDMVNIAEYERAIVSRRTRLKMFAAKQRGIHCGRPRKLDQEATRKAYGQWLKGEQSIGDIATSVRVSVPTLRRSFKYWNMV